MPDDGAQDHLIVSFEPAGFDCSVYQEMQPPTSKVAAFKSAEAHLQTTMSRAATQQKAPAGRRGLGRSMTGKR